ncbi:hydrophobin-251 [Pholiota molesta]|nr:hydrophobin-251 [Pholiota molesta]
MFSKLALFTAASMAVFHSCNTGKVQCCNSLAASNTSGFSQMFELLGISLNGVTGQVGVVCSPISVGAPASCCSENHFNGLLAVGCTPINVAL